MSRAGEGFEIEQRPNGLFDVTYGGRAVAYDRDDLAEALAAIRNWRRRRNIPDDAPITFVHKDGYREVVPR